MMEALSWILYLGGIGLAGLLFVLICIEWVTKERWRNPPVWKPDEIGETDDRLLDLDPKWVEKELDEVDQRLILPPK